MIKLINILNEQDEQEKQNPFDKYGVRVKDVEQKKDLPEPTKKKVAPTSVLKRPPEQPGTKITTVEFTTFKNKLANRLGIKLTLERQRFFEAWRRAENTTATYNPFATSWPGIGTTKWSRDPGMTIFNWTKEPQPQSGKYETMVKKYSNLDAGVEATAKTLEQSYFTNLLESIRDDSKTAEQIVESSRAQINLWGTGAQNMLTKLKGIAPAGEEDTFKPPTPPDELVSISTMNSYEADSHFWDIVTKWVEAEYKFWEGTGTGPAGVKNPETHDEMFAQFNDYSDDKEKLAQKQYYRTRKPALIKLVKQLVQYEDIRDLVTQYGGSALFRNSQPDDYAYKGKIYSVPKGTPDYAKNRIRWVLQTFNWIEQITGNITDVFQNDIEIALEWDEGGKAFRRSVQAEIDPYVQKGMIRLLPYLF